jgi:uncharacterized membrane protein required for colicin V production
MIHMLVEGTQFSEIEEIIIIIIITYLLTYLLTHLLTYLLNYLLQLSFHSVAVFLTVVQTKQIRINIHKRNNKKHSKNKHTYYQNVHTIVKTSPHTHTHTLQNNIKQQQKKIYTKLNRNETKKNPQ